MRLITRPEQIGQEDEREFSRPSRRRFLRTRRNPVQQLEYRNRKPSDRPLKDLPLIEGGHIKGKDRCHVIGLPSGPCRQYRWRDSVYCMYHEKLRAGLTTPTADTYPVWPLPDSGYVLLEESGREWVA